MSAQSNPQSVWMVAEHLRRIQGFRLMDDRFMRACLSDNIPCVELVLRIILGKPDLKVLSAQTQHPLESLRGTRSVWLDVFARDEAGRLTTWRFSARAWTRSAAVCTFR